MPNCPKSKYQTQILNGQGGGTIAHITSVTEDAGTYTVTIDAQVGVAGETAVVRFDNWQKVPKEMTSHLERFGIGENGTFGQFKILLSGKAGRPEIRELIIKTNPKET